MTTTPHKHHGRTEQEQARFIKRTIGTKQAAVYLKNRGWTIEGTLFVLLGI